MENTYWNDPWNRVRQLAYRHHVIIQPQDTLYSCLSKLDKAMGMKPCKAREQLEVEDHLRLLESVSKTLTSTDQWGSSECFRLEKLEHEWSIPLDKRLAPVGRLERLEDFIGKPHPTEETIDFRLHSLETYPYWAVNCIHDCEQLEKSWDIHPHLPALLSTRVEALEQFVGRIPFSCSGYVARITDLKQYPLRHIRQLNRITKLEKDWGIPVDPSLGLVQRILVLEQKAGQPSPHNRTYAKRLDTLESIKRRNEKMSDAASHDQSYTKWRSLCNQRILGIEEKWELNPTNPGNLFEARLDNLEFQLGLETDSHLSVDKRLDRLEGVTKNQVEAMKQVKQLEDKWGIASYMGQSIEDRLKHLELFKNLKSPDNKSIRDRIDELIILSQLEDVNIDLSSIQEMEKHWKITPSSDQSVEDRLYQLRDKVTDIYFMPELFTISVQEQFNQMWDTYQAEINPVNEVNALQKLHQRIHWLESKYQVPMTPELLEMPPDLELHVSNLEWYLGEPIQNSLSYDLRLSLLEKEPEWLMDGLKKVREMESYWSIKTNKGQILKDRLDAISNTRQINFDSTVPMSLRIERMWEVYQNERNDNMHEGIILGPNPVAIPVNGPDEKPSVDPKNLDKFKSLIESVEGEIPHDMGNILELLPYILKLQLQKSAVYGRSYCRHGDLSIFLNTERKWDRISNIMDKAMKDGTDFLYSDKAGTATETFLDTVVDLASYALLWVGYIKETHPEAFQKFLDDNHLDIS